MSKTTVYSQLLTTSNTPITNRTINCILEVPDSWQQENPNVIIQAISTKTDSTGTFYFYLTPQSQIDAPNSYYKIWYIGKIWYIIVPNSSSQVEINSIIIDPTTLTTPVVSTSTTSETQIANLTNDLANRLVKSNNLSDLTNAPVALSNLGIGTLVNTFNGRSGTVTPANGDYSATQVTNAALDSTVIHNSGNETINGVKTFNSAPLLPAGSLPESSITNLVSDLSSKYIKPGSGIPSTDMTSAVQTSLGLANTALQSAPVTSVAGRTGAIILGESDITNLTNDLASKLSSTGGTISGNLTITGTFTPSGGYAPGYDIRPSGALPADHGFSSWSYDPILTSSSSLLVVGTLYMIGIFIRNNTTISKLYWAQSIAGVSPVSNQSYAGLYNSSGTLLSSVNIDSLVVSSNSVQSATIGTPQSVTSGLYWVGILFNAITNPTLLKAGGLLNPINNANISNNLLRFATNGTALTSLPTSITPSSNSSGPSIWVAVS